MTFTILCDGSMKKYHAPVLVAELPDGREPIRIDTFPLAVALRGDELLTPMEAALSVFGGDARNRYPLPCRDPDCDRDASLTDTNLRMVRRFLEGIGVHQATLSDLEYWVRKLDRG